MQTHRIASPEEWLAARKAHLAKEKELTRLRDKLNAERRQLPWVRVEKTYVFDTRDGKKTLAELFEGRSQLIVQHFMFGPDWAEGWLLLCGRSYRKCPSPYSASRCELRQDLAGAARQA